MRNSNYYSVNYRFESNFKIIFYSLLLTTFIFLILPLTQGFVTKKKDIKVIRKIETIEIKKRPHRKKFLKHRVVYKKARIRLTSTSSSKLPAPLKINVPLLPPAPAWGDFSLGFKLKGEDIAEQLVFEISEVDRPPHPYVRILPIYPLQAKLRGIEGKVELEFIVDREGDVVPESIKVLSFSSPIFVKSSINAVKRWKFRPAVKEGETVAVRVTVPIKFELK
ncbi:MAG: hypothetical protein B6D55_02505 [Candidatus Omnitrophica bacterium 4484_70.2]|nr:MAG: hypothetical protein B6D55_02505 [Candidatus Omnitrophica bacterium 4484_70.2]